MHRIADVQLRGPGGPLAARAYWPAPHDPLAAPALLVLLPGDAAAAGRLAWVDALCRGACAELGADPGQLLLAGTGVGGGLAAAVARQARDDGWPAIKRQVSIQPGTAARMRQTLARSLRPALEAG